MSTFQNDKQEYQKWDYITLSDFRSASIGKLFSYAWLWFLAAVAVAVYAADSYTAINLLVFGRWSSQIQPAIPFSISKWIFAGCILFSWVLCIYEWIRAVAIIRRNNVAESYLDPLTVTLQSIRLTKKGRGWRKFLVFAALTKSKKGADYIALFVYFQFKGAIRLLLAESPRQIINGMSLLSVMQAQLLPTGQNSGNPFIQFFKNIELLAQHETEQATTLFTMLFTFIIWVVSFLSFVAACLGYVFFLWHYIPKEDGTLTKYCRRKIDKRLARIVSNKVQEAMEMSDAKYAKDQELGISKPESVFDPLSRKPTLALTKDTDSDYQASVLRGNPSLSRSDSTWKPPQSSSSQKSFTSTARLIRQPTLPQIEDPVSPRPNQHETQEPMETREPTLPNLGDDPAPATRPPGLVRTITEPSGLSNTSNRSIQPLLPQTIDRGYSESPAPIEGTHSVQLPSRLNTVSGRRPPPAASQSASSTPYPDDNSVMGRESSVRKKQMIPAPLTAPPPDRPLPAFPKQQSQRRPNNPTTTRQREQPSSSPEREIQSQQPPPSLRVGPPAQPKRSPSPPAATLPSDVRQYDGNRDIGGPPTRSATAGPGARRPQQGQERPPPPQRVGTAPPLSAPRRNDEYSRPMYGNGPPRSGPPRGPHPLSRSGFGYDEGAGAGAGAGADAGYRQRQGPLYPSPSTSRQQPFPARNGGGLPPPPSGRGPGMGAPNMEGESRGAGGSRPGYTAYHYGY